MKNIKALIALIYTKYTKFVETMLIIAIFGNSIALSISPVNLGSTSDFVILAGSTITGILPITITGNVGLSPAAGSLIVGFDSANVVGTIYTVDATGPVGSVMNPTLLQTAKSDLTIAYNDAAGRTPVPTGPFLNPGSSNIGGLNLVPGLYKFTSACGITGSDLTLTGSATDVWIFQIGTALDVGSGIKIILAGGAQAANVFWQVGSSATLGTYSEFKGTIMADQSISLNTGATIDGRCLAFTGAVTMGGGVTTTKSILSFPEFLAIPDSLNFGTVSVGFSKMDSILVENVGIGNLVITGVTSSNILFSISPTASTIQEGDSLKYYISFDPLTTLPDTSMFIFSHNGTPMQDTIIVTGNPPFGDYSILPDSLNFGDVSTGQSKMDSVTVTNNGTSNLIITNITSSNSTYEVNPIMGTILPGDSLKYYVTFAPLTTGLDDGFVVFTHNAALSPDTVTVTGTGVEPIFTANPINLNFGDVSTGQSKMDSVTVTNNGTSNLIITNITSSNSTYEVNPIMGTILPGDSLKYYVTFAPLTTGLDDGFVVFTHNAALSPDTVTVTGTGVASEFAILPSSLNFGNVRIGLTKMDSVTISNSGTSNLTISSITSSNPLFSITPLNGTIAPGASQKFYVTFAPLTFGLKTGTFSFNHNASATPATMNVTGTGVEPIFTANPTNLNFGNVSTGQSKMDSVTVTNNGTSNLIISNVTSSNGSFAVNPIMGTILPGASQKYYVTFAPLTTGLDDGFVVFTHNAALSPDTVTVTGTGVSSMFSVSANSLSFGDVRIGLTKTDSVIVTNNGSSNLVISDITSSNLLFSISQVNGTIAPGGSAKFYVTFAPLTNGFENGYMYFYHNASVTPTVITVDGTGVEPIFALTPTIIDFGDVDTGSSHIDSITVTNTGTSNLIITNVTSSNSSFVVTPYVATITPGNSKIFQVMFTPLTDGLKTGTLTFVNNATVLNNTVSVSGAGIGIPLEPVFSASPINLDFGYVKLGTSKLDSVTVTNTGNANLIITNVSSSNFSYHVSPLMGTITPGESKKFYVTFAPLTNGTHNSIILFTNNTLDGMNLISATGVGLSPMMSVTPTLLDYGTVKVDTSKSKSFTVTNNGNDNLIITNVTSSHSSYLISETKIVIAPGASHTFYVTFYPIASGQINANIAIESNASTGNAVVIVTGFGQGDDLQPIFTVTPRYIDFGLVATGTSKLDNVTVTNIGNANLIISDVTSSSSKFTVSPKSIVIAPGASYQFYITFSPSKNGTQSATLIFENNATNVNNTVVVSGNGFGTEYEPIFIAITDSLDFGYVRLGKTVSESIRISNIGNENLIITKITSTDFSFKISPVTGVGPLDGTILPGASIVYNVEFTPTSIGPKYAEIHFESNAAFFIYLLYIN